MKFVLMVALFAGYFSLAAERIGKPVDGCTESPSPTFPRCNKTLPVSG